MARLDNSGHISRSPNGVSNLPWNFLQGCPIASFITFQLRRNKPCHIIMSSLKSFFKSVSSGHISRSPDSVLICLGTSCKSAQLPCSSLSNFSEISLTSLFHVTKSVSPSILLQPFYIFPLPFPSFNLFAFPSTSRVSRAHSTDLQLATRLSYILVKVRAEGV